MSTAPATTPNVKFIDAPFAARPTTATLGTFFYATDTGALYVFEANLTNGTRGWVLIALAPGGIPQFTVATLPAVTSANNGTLAWATDGANPGDTGAGTGTLVEAKTSGPNGAGWYTVGTAYPVVAVGYANVYLNATTGNDANAGTTPGTAWRTLARLKTLLATGVQPSTVNFTDVAPTIYTLVGTLNFKKVVADPSINGPDVFLLGSFSDVGYGTLTATGVATQTVGAFSQSRVTVAGTPFSVTGAGDAENTIAVLTGVAAGSRSQLGGALPNASFVQTAFGTIGGMVPGDTFQVQKPRITIQSVNGGGTFGINAGSGVVMARGITFSFPVANSLDMSLADGEFILPSCQINSDNGRLRPTNATICAFGPFIDGFRTLPASFPVLPGFNEGLAVNDATEAIGGITWQGECGLYGQSVLQLVTVDTTVEFSGGTNRAFMNLISHGPTSSAESHVQLRGDVAQQAAGSIGPVVTAAIYPSASSVDGIFAAGDSVQFQIPALAVLPGYGAGKLTGAGLHVTAYAVVDATALTGTAASISGTGAVFATGGKLRVTDANVGSTITGTVGAIKVGANAVDTWALVAGGLSVHVSDFAQPSPQFCTVVIA